MRLDENVLVLVALVCRRADNGATLGRRRYKTGLGSALTEAGLKFGAYKNMLRISPGLSNGAQHAAPLRRLVAHATRKAASSRRTPD
jgi:hypothetical protein